MANIRLHKIAVGHDNPGGLTLFTALETDSGYRLPPVRVVGSYDPGELEMRGDFSLTVAGIAMAMLQWDIWEEPDAYTMFKTDYCNGGYSGPVTVEIPTNLPGTYVQFNAMLHLPKENEMNFEGETGWYRDVKLRLLDLEIIA